jgi:hypothetical protein
VNTLIKACASLKLTVVCLLLLMVLVFWGTLYQVEHGLYAAQHRFYNSWVFLILGVLPFPGSQLVMSVLFINLLAAMAAHFHYGWRHLGILLIHAGILLLLGGGFVIYHVARESFLTLVEGEGGNCSTSWDTWELALWPGEEDTRRVMAVRAGPELIHRPVEFPETGLRVQAETYHPNSRALRRRAGSEETDAISPSGIHFLEPKPREKEPVQNIPGGLFRVSAPGLPEQRVLLYGDDREPFRITLGDQTYQLSLRRQRHPLPVLVRLLDFRREMHPNTEVAKSFSSQIEVDLKGMRRPVLIRMNEPFRYQGYTLYQASYAILEDGRESSTFAVVYNVGRLLPYVASVVTFLGLINHFLIAIFFRKETPGS